MSSSSLFCFCFLFLPYSFCFTFHIVLLILIGFDFWIWFRKLFQSLRQLEWLKLATSIFMLYLYSMRFSLIEYGFSTRIFFTSWGSVSVLDRGYLFPPSGYLLFHPVRYYFNDIGLFQVCETSSKNYYLYKQLSPN